jgi:hypothetical protein
MDVTVRSESFTKMTKCVAASTDVAHPKVKSRKADGAHDRSPRRLLRKY